MKTTWIRKNPIPTFIIACLLPVHLILWASLALGAAQESLKGLKLLFALLPSSAAFLIVFIQHQEKGIHTFWKNTFKKGTSWYFYPISSLLFLLIALLAIVCRYFWDEHIPSLAQSPSLLEIIVISPFLLLFPGFAEEYGWRAFLQERLQTRWSVFGASLFVGLIWGTWHTMDFLMGNWPANTFFVSVFYLYIIACAMLIGYLYTYSNGNVFIAMLGHFSANAVNFFTPIWQNEEGLITPSIYIGLLWIIAIGLGIRELITKLKTRKLLSKDP